jgi:transcriptional regulator with XRE-family HTH domain
MREKKGWSQQELAKEVGMGQARISLLENPNYQTLSLSTLKRVANVFDVALVVRFIPFSKLFEMLDSETESTLAVLSFEDEFGTEANPITTPGSKVIDLAHQLKELHLDGPPEGSAQLKPDLLYDVRRISGATSDITTPTTVTGTLRNPTDAYGQPAFGEAQNSDILYQAHPIGALHAS